MIKGIGPTDVSRLALDAARKAGDAGKVDRAPATRTLDSAVASPTMQVTQMVAEGPPVATDKVAALKAAIANGSYRIDADAIADRMIANDCPDAAK